MRTPQGGQSATVSRGRKLLNIRQGNRNIEVYARDVVGVARQSPTEKACLVVFFWGGLAKPFMSRMPYWHLEESLEEYINLALSLSGSAFRMQHPLHEPRESVPKPAPFREPTESAPEPAPFCEPTPEPAPFREPTEPTLKAYVAAIATHNVAVDDR